MALGHLRDRPISSGAGQWLPMVRTIHKKSSLSSSQMCSKQTPGPPPPFREMGRKSDLCSTVHGGSCDNFGATGRLSVDGPEDTQPLSQRVRRLEKPAFFSSTSTNAVAFLGF